MAEVSNYRVAMGMMYGHPGKKLIFMGGEFAQFSRGVKQGLWIGIIAV